MDSARTDRQQWETQDYELMRSTSQKIILMVSGSYLAVHFVTTLGWPQIFSPSMWVCTLMMALTLVVSLSLLERHFLLAQLAWFAGLTFSLFIAYSFYTRPELIFLLALFPMMAEVMIGLRSAMIMEGLILALMVFWPDFHFLAPLPPGYALSLGMASLATTGLGWALSHNLISAIESSGFHYHEALRNLEEARQHRAEISSLLNEVNKANYQLDRLNTMLGFARARAEEAREERNRFAMAVSHELRSPLNFIIGFSDLMVNSPETYAGLEAWPPGLYDDIHEIYRSSNHLMGLINDILDMGKIDARQMTLFREKTTLAAIFAEVRDMVEVAVKKKNLKLDMDLEPDLPPIYVDETRIRQVLLNLVTNALRFTESGTIRAKGRLKSPGLIEIEVSDTGAGIAREDLDKIFHEFRQVGNQNWQRAEGTGLGLAIGRRFILLHGGEMTVESEAGRGSTFRFTLPVRSEEEEVEVIAARGLLNPEEYSSDDSEQLAARRAFEKNESNRSPMLLFLAEDLFWARIFAELLTDYKVTLLSDPAQLGDVTRQVYPRAVIIDQSLSGHPDVQAFTAAPPYDVPIITFPIPINLNRVTRLPEGVDQYLIKPVARQKLMETVMAVGKPVHTVLVVDDDPAMVRFVVQSLKGQVGQPAQEEGGPAVGFDLEEAVFLTAYNAADALMQLKAQPVDLVLLDLELPDLNGLLLIEQVRQEESLRQIPIIIVSANDLPQALSSSQRSIYQVAINRPFQRSELADILKSTIGDLLPTYFAGENKDKESQTPAD